MEKIMTQTIAQIIVDRATSSHTILCWDGSNSKADLLENIRHYVSNHTGHQKLAVSFENGKLEIHAEILYTPAQVHDSMLPPPESMPDYVHLLTYHVDSGREIYGRLRHCGFYYPHLAEFKILSKAV